MGGGSLASYDSIIKSAASFEEEFSLLSPNELKNKTDEFRERMKKGEGQEALLPETFAAVREVSKRVL